MSDVERLRLEARWNAVRCEQEALEGRKWTPKADHRDDFHFTRVETPAPSEAGYRVATVTAWGKLHDPARSIDWSRDVLYHPPRSPDAAAQGAPGALIPAMFGVDPAEPLNAGPPCADPAWKQVEAGLAYQSRRKDQRPIAVEVSRTSMVDRRKNQFDFPPVVSARGPEGVVELSVSAKVIEHGHEATVSHPVKLDHYYLDAPAERVTPSAPTQTAPTQTAQDHPVVAAPKIGGMRR
jgi:hypothetical protein